MSGQRHIETTVVTEKARRYVMKIIKKMVAVIIITLMIGSVSVSAKGISGKVRDDQGGIYIVKDGRIQYGLFRYHGNLYYAYKKTTRWHKRGTLARDCHKVIKGKWYYFRHSGKAQKHDNDHLDVRRDGTIKYIYVTPTMRYSAAHKRYQVRKRKKWVDVGMQFNWDYDHDM